MIRVSASSVQMFRACPAQYAFHLHYRPVASPENEGTILHKALERGERPANIDLLIPYEAAREAVARLGTPVAREIRYDYVVHHPAGVPVAVARIIDALVANNDGELEIVDYKLRPQIPDYLLARMPQTLFYLKPFGERAWPQRMHYIFLSRDSPRARVVTISYHPGAWAEVVATVDRMVRAYQEGTFEKAYGPYCATCDFFRLCYYGEARFLEEAIPSVRSDVRELAWEEFADPWF